VTNELPEACLGLDEDLSALIDEELSPEREAEVRAHLDTCDRCALRLQELCNVDLELAGLAQPAVSPDLSSSLMARIALESEAHAHEDAEAAAPRKSARAAAPTARRRWLSGPGLARIAVAAGLVLAAWLVLRSDPGVEPEVPVAVTPPQVPVVPAPEVDRPAGTLVVERAAPAETRVAERAPAPGAPPAPAPGEREGGDEGQGGAWGDLQPEDLAMLLELDEVEDLDLIANLELLETLVDLEREAG
jgi:anti-sigma factor RsiW